MDYNLILYIASAVVLLVLLLWGLRRYRRRRIVAQWHEDADETPLADVDLAVSMVVVCRNMGMELEENFPYLYEQQGVEMEHIIVNAASEDSTSDVLKRLTFRYPRLRQTYVPSTHANLDVERMGAMLGARAARHEWVLLVRPDFRPPSASWLLDLLQYADTSLMAVVDYGHRPGIDLLSRFRRIREYRKMARLARSGRAMVTADGSVLIQREALLASCSEEGVSGEILYLYWLLWPWQRVILRVRSRL